MSQTGTWLSKLIKMYTGEEYNHISISLDDTLSTMYSFGRINPVNPFSGGFVLENINDGVFKIFTESRCKVYKLEITDEQYEKLRKNLTEFEKEKNHYRYNFLGLFYVALNLDKPRRNRYFCSQFVAEVIHNSEIHNFNKPFNLVTVKDFVNIPNMYPVFEGSTQGVLESITV